MAQFYSLNGLKPKLLGDGHFVAPTATLIGQVILEAESSVWFGVVVRADNDVIRIGRKSNVQDGAVLHTDEGIQLTVGEGVTIGHKAVLHGCNIGDFSLIGINATILNRAKIGAFCIIGANTLVPEGMVVPDGVLVLGSPARIKRQLTESEMQTLKQSAEHYVENSVRYLSELKCDN